MSVIEKLDSVLGRLGETSEGHYLSRLANGTSIALEAVNLLRDHGPAIRQDMIDAEKWRFCTSEHELGDGQTAKMHINVGVNVWRGEEWLGFHECSPDEAREAIDASRATGEGEGHD